MNGNANLRIELDFILIDIYFILLIYESSVLFY